MTGGSTANKAADQIWGCNDNKWQFWTFISDANGYVIQYNCHFDGSDHFEDWQATNCLGSYCDYENRGYQDAGHDYYMRPADCGTTDGKRIYMNTACTNGADLWD